MNTTTRQYDIAIAGGGLSGVAAAVAATREGLSVVLVEKNGYLGGMATAGLVSQFMPYSFWLGDWDIDWPNQVNRGIFAEILTDLRNMDALAANHIMFSEECMKIVLDRMIKKYQINVLLHTMLTDVHMNRNAIGSLVTHSKSGRIDICAAYFIDATGDADLSALAGCQYKIGRETDGQCQPMTLIFRIGGVDVTLFDPVRMRKSIDEKFLEMKSKGLIKNPNDRILAFNHMIKGVIHLNATRITGKSSIDTDDLTWAEIEAREQAWTIFRFLKENFLGFEDSKLLMSAPHIGIRESRRIDGEYQLQAHDLISGRKFTDSIARGTYPLDIHNPSGGGINTTPIPFGDYYTIPYRSLIPLDVDNLLVAGRPISSTHEAHSAHRIMPICTCIGEGAGIAASLAFQHGCKCKNVDINKVHEIMDKNNALY